MLAKSSFSYCKYSYISLYILFLALFLPLPALADGKWYSFGESEMPEGTPPIIKVLEDDSYHTTLEITIPGMWVEEVNEGGYTFQKLELPEYSTLLDIGKPAIPAIGTFVGYLEPSTNSIKYEDEEKFVLEDMFIYPAQRPIYAGDDYSDYPFEFDEKFYSQDIWYPEEPANVSETMIMREVCVSHTGIVPFEYNPAKRELIVHAKILVTVNHQPGAEGYEDWSMPIGADSTFVKMYRSLIVNYDNLGLAEVDTVSEYDYLIITHSSFYATADKFADYLEQNRGHSVFVTTKDTTNWVDIYNIIKKFYELYKNRYVLLFGDDDFIPIPYREWSDPFTMTTYQMPSDTVYSCLSGDDYIPEVVVGRFSVSNNEEALTYCTKVKEHYEYMDPDRILKCLLVANKDPRNDYTYVRGKDSINNSLYLVYDPIFLKLYGTDPRVDNDALISFIENGQMIVNYYGNGEVDCSFPHPGGCWTDWCQGGHPESCFSQELIDEISTGNQRPVIFSIAGWTGDITYYENGDCFCEHWMNVPGGAVGVIGATFYFYTTAGTPFDCWLFHSLYSMGYGELGIVHTFAKLRMFEELYGGGYDARQIAIGAYLSFLLLGEPSLWILPQDPSSVFGQNMPLKEKLSKEELHNPILTIYPNPVDDLVNLSIEDAQCGDAEVKIYDLSGRLIIAKKFIINEGDNLIAIDLKGLDIKSGVYVVSFNASGISKSQRIVYSPQLK